MSNLESMLKRTARKGTTSPRDLRCPGCVHLPKHRAAKWLWLDALSEEVNGASSLSETYLVASTGAVWVVFAPKKLAKAVATLKPRRRRGGTA